MSRKLDPLGVTNDLQPSISGFNGFGFCSIGSGSPRASIALQTASARIAVIQLIKLDSKFKINRDCECGELHVANELLIVRTLLDLLMDAK